MPWLRNDIQHFLELLFTMTDKELRARYKYTIFGFFWLVLNPIMQMIVIGFIFTFFMEEKILNYYHHLFLGLLLWDFFSLSMTKTTPSIVYERGLIKKSKFPNEVIPLSIIVSNLVNLVVALGIYLVIAIFIGFGDHINLIKTVFSLVLLLSFTTGASLLTSALNVKFRDVNFFVQAILAVWFYATPIVYSLQNIPTEFRWLWGFNPMTTIIMMLRNSFIGGDIPETPIIVINVVVVVLVLLLGVSVFKKEKKYFDDWV